MVRDEIPDERYPSVRTIDCHWLVGPRRRNSSNQFSTARQSQTQDPLGSLGSPLGLTARAAGLTFAESIVFVLVGFSFNRSSLAIVHLREFGFRPDYLLACF
jgi:hypothetical protein